MEFPRLVYKSATSHVLVQNQDEMDGALANGYFATVPEALGETDLPPLKKAVLVKAEDLSGSVAPSVVPAKGSKAGKAAVPVAAAAPPVVPVVPVAPSADGEKKPWD